MCLDRISPWRHSAGDIQRFLLPPQSNKCHWVSGNWLSEKGWVNLVAFCRVASLCQHGQTEPPPSNTSFIPRKIYRPLPPHPTSFHTAHQKTACYKKTTILISPACPACTNVSPEPSKCSPRASRAPAAMGRPDGSSTTGAVHAVPVSKLTEVGWRLSLSLATGFKKALLFVGELHRIAFDISCDHI